MANIKPFKAVRPGNGLEKQIAALPYDVYNTEEARRIVMNNPLSFLKIDRAETMFPREDKVPFDDPRVYKMAAGLLKDEIEKGDLVKEDSDCFYVYSQTMNQRTQTGIVACVSIDDYLNGVIKKHENTRADKERDRICHVDTCNAQTGPIFLAYRRNRKLTDLVNRAREKTALYDFISEDGVRHRVWIVSDTGEIEAVRDIFSKMKDIYIADGHHRCASAVKVGLMRRERQKQFTGNEEFNYFLSVLFPDDELKILDYNRVVKDLNGYTVEEFLKEVQKNFEVEKAGQNEYRPVARHTFGMYLDGMWYKLTAKDFIQSEDPVLGLDVSILQNFLLRPVLGIKDPKTDKRIDFVGGIRGLSELARRADDDMRVAFSMYPTSIGELFSVADAGQLMPPKSTWFEPKLRSGLFIHQI